MKTIEGIPVYQVNALDSEITAVSLVKYPAVEETFQYFNSDKKPVNFSADSEQRMIYGVALRADYPIYRVSDGYEYYIMFSKEAVNQLSKQFMMDNRNNSWTLEHEIPTDRLTITESWIKLSEQYDKSNALGIDAPVGSWVIGVYCDSNEIWQRVKNKEFEGFSIESFLSLDEIINTNFNKMDNKDEKMNKFMDAFRSFLSDFLVKEDEVEMNAEEQPQAEAETPEVEPESAEEEKIEETQEEVQEEPENELVIDESAPAIEESEEQKLSSVIAELEAKLKELEQENSSLHDEVEKLSKQPSADPVNVNANKIDNREFLRQIANKF